MDAVTFRAALREIGLSQRALSMRLGLAVSTVNHWATGKAPVPQYAAAYLDLLRDLQAVVRRLQEILAERAR